MANEHMKTCSTSQALRKKANPTNSDIHSHPRQKITNGAEDVGKRDPYTLLMWI